MLECVVNVSEGRDSRVIAALADAGGETVRDVHRDADHHRSVLTLAGAPEATESAARSVARAAVKAIDLHAHAGAHPRFGSLDVVPFVALERPGFDGDLRPADPAGAVAARDRFAAWLGETLGVPTFCYGTERSLPEVRKRAWDSLAPTAGPPRPHPSAGATAVGARPVLVAYNLWLADADVGTARRIAAELRGPAVRALGLALGQRRIQVSCNLIDPWTLGPAAVFDAVAGRAAVRRAELVGLLPRAVLRAVPRERWATLDLSPEATIESRLERPSPRPHPGSWPVAR